MSPAYAVMQRAERANLEERDNLLNVSVNRRATASEEEDDARGLQVLAELLGLIRLVKYKIGAYVLNSPDLLFQVVLFGQICAFFNLQGITRKAAWIVPYPRTYCLR